MEAESGADSSDLLTQATQAVAHGATYVPWLMGHNDICQDYISQIPSEEEFEENAWQALIKLSELPKGATIYVVGMVNVPMLYSVAKNKKALGIVDCEVLWFFTLFELFPCGTVLGPFRTDADRMTMSDRIAGSEFYEGIVTTDDFLYYADGRRKRINKIVPGKEQAISVIKGIDSLLDKQSFESVRAGFDRGYNEAIFCIDDSLTLAFNEPMDAFSSSYSYIPGYMLSIGNDFYSTGTTVDDIPWQYQSLDEYNVGYIGESDSDLDWDYVLIGGVSEGGTLFKHGVGDKGSFYGSEEVADSTLELIINPNGNIVNSFDNLDLRTESTLNDVDQVNDIFYELEASNDYQSITRALTFNASTTQSTGSIKRIGRVWRTPLIPVQTSGANFKRMVDTYVKVVLKYSNTGSNTFRVHDIITYYRPSNH